MKEEKVLSDKIKIDMKVDLKISGCKNDMGKVATLHIQKKLIDVLIMKSSIQITNQVDVLENFTILDLEKRPVNF